MLPNGNFQTEQEEFKLTRVFSRYRVLDFIIKSLFFLLSVMIVFLDNDYENGEFMLVFVKYKCKAVSRNIKMTISHSALLNLSKSGELEGEFTVQKLFLLAHVFSVVLYSAVVTGLFVFLAIISLGDTALSAVFFVLSGVTACVSVYIVYYSAKRYTKTLNYLNDYYQNYVY